MADSMPLAYEGWAVVEQFGHRRLAGYIRPVSMYGAEMARLDIPAVDDQPARTQYLGGSSIYGLHPCDETIARVAAKAMPEPPVSRWEIRQALPATVPDPAPAPDPAPGPCHHPEGYYDSYPGDDREEQPDPDELADMVAYTEDPAVRDDQELPGMWSTADFTGGEEVVRGPATTPA